MIYLYKTLEAYKSDDFRQIAKTEIEAIDMKALPLQSALQQSSTVSNSDFTVMILDAHIDADFLFVKTGILFNGIIAGCNCADDPTPMNENNEFCEVLFKININTAATQINLIS